MAEIRKPAVPQAGSPMVSSGRGSTISTILRMMCLGVRNWPLMPAVVSLLSKYSYRSPLVSPSVRGSLSIMLTADTRRFGFWIINWASFMYSANVPPFSTTSLKWGNTSSRTSRSISVAGVTFLNWDHRRFCLPFGKIRLKFFPVRLAFFSSRVSRISSRRANIRNEICSITIKGLVMPPVQNSVQSLSTWFLSSLLIMCFLAPIFELTADTRRHSQTLSKISFKGPDG